MQHQWTFLSTSVIMLVATVRSYPTGAPAGACDAMFPTGHGVEGQTSAFPFNMTVSSQIYCPGWEIDVTVSGGTFKGFICQPRPNTNTYETFGTLTSNNTFGTTNNCQGKAALTHSDRNQKTSLHLKWQTEASASPVDNVFIVCTIVVEKLTFWVKQTIMISYPGNTSCAEAEFQKCAEKFGSAPKCGENLSFLSLMVNRTTKTEVCTLVKKFKEETLLCYKNTFPECQAEAERYMNQYDDYINSLFPNISNCTDLDIDLCGSTQALAAVSCLSVIQEISVPSSSLSGEEKECKIRQCLDSFEAPTGCTASSSDDIAAAVQRFYGIPLPFCLDNLPSPCTAEYFVPAVRYTCPDSWQAYNATTDASQCQHYEQFVSCIKYQALTTGQTCTVGQIHAAIQSAVQAAGKPAQICTGSTVQGLEALFPATKAGVCSSVNIMAHMISYICSKQYANYWATTDMEHRCRMEAQMRACVFNILKTTAGCSDEGPVASAFQNTTLRTRTGLNLSDSCDTTYGCQTFMVSRTWDLAAKCFHGVVGSLYFESLTSLKVYKSTTELLKCKAYEQALGCFVVSFGDEAIAAGCDLTKLDTEIHPDFMESLQATADTLAETLPVSPFYDAIQAYSQCSIRTLPDAPECPDEAALVTTVTVNCGPTVLGMVWNRSATAQDRCNYMEACLKEIEKWFVDYKLCEADIGRRIYLVEKSEDAADYFQTVSLFDWMTCTTTPKALGDSCYADEECGNVANAECSDGECSCQERYKKQNSQCVFNGAERGVLVSMVTVLICLLLAYHL